MSHIRPATPSPRDVLGTVKYCRWQAQETATLLRMVRKIAFDAGYEAEVNSKEFDALHHIDLLLTCIVDRTDADAELLDALETHLQCNAGRRAKA